LFEVWSLVLYFWIEINFWLYLCLHPKGESWSIYCEITSKN